MACRGRTRPVGRLKFSPAGSECNYTGEKQIITRDNWRKFLQSSRKCCTINSLIEIKIASGTPRMSDRPNQRYTPCIYIFSALLTSIMVSITWQEWWIRSFWIIFRISAIRKSPRRIGPSEMDRKGCTRLQDQRCRWNHRIRPANVSLLHYKRPRRQYLQI